MTKKALCQIYKSYVPDIDKYTLAQMSKKELKSRSSNEYHSFEIRLMRFCNKVLSKS